MKLIENIKQISEKVKDKILNIFNKKTLNELAKKVGFVRRTTSRIEGEDFVKLMTTEILGEELISTEGLCDILRQINPKANMTPQALNERFNKKEASEYLKEVFESAFKENLRPVRSKISPDLLSPFGRVLLHDSTQITLHEKLADNFKGSGGSASKSSVKIDLTYEMKQDILENIQISSGNVPDQSSAEKIFAVIRENDLIIRDLGYFTLESLDGIAKNNAFFLSRLLKGVNVYLSKDDASAVNIPKFFDKKFKKQSVAEITAYLGEKKLPCRLIAYRLPDEVVNERCRKAQSSARKKGRQPTEDYLNWLRFGFYITNVPVEVWEPDVIGTIYRLRWQIELTFKHWKSLLNIHILKGTLPGRIRCFLYGRLIAITIITMLSGYASWYAYNYLKKEASFHKLINWLNRKERLAKALRTNGLETLFEELTRDIGKRLCKQKRKRKTTRQLIEEGIPYMESFLPEESYGI